MALKKLFEEGVVKREDLFITSKLWYAQISGDIPIFMCHASQVEYIDAYLKFSIIHVDLIWGWLMFPGMIIMLLKMCLRH